MAGQRVYTLEDLNAYIKSLPERYYGAGERSEASNEESDDQEANNPTVDEFAGEYYRDHCLVRNKRPDFKEHALKPIRKYFGKRRMKDLRRVHVHDFVSHPSKQVKPATVNRSIAVLKNMLSSP